jgi:Pyruvate/2-oxoacid:ferredoxin oxidoreductase gamma subunit
MSAEPRVIAEFYDYSGLVDAMRTRATERKLALSADVNANVAGLTDGYIAKLIGANPVKRFGMVSLGALAGVLAVKFIMVADEDAEQRFGRRLKTRNGNLVRDDVTVVRLTSRHMKKIGATGKQLRWKKLTKEERAAVMRELNRARWSKLNAKQRSEFMRNLVKARWSKPRVVEINGAAARAARSKATRSASESASRPKAAGTGAMKGRARPR